MRCTCHNRLKWAERTSTTRFGVQVRIRNGCGRDPDAVPGREKHEAAAAVPDELVRDTSLIGPPSYVKERVAAFAAAGVTTLNVAPVAGDSADRVRQIRLLLGVGMTLGKWIQGVVSAESMFTAGVGRAQKHAHGDVWPSRNGAWSQGGVV
jgi:hypothetical protein